MADGELGLTRWRDMAAVAAVVAVVVKLLLVWNYQRIPPLPVAAGVPAAVIGLGELAFGVGLRRRIRERQQRATRPVTGTGARSQDPAVDRPLDVLTVARSLMVAKATALAGAAFLGIWVGVAVHVLPLADQLTAAAHDRTAALIGLVGAVVMTGGALFLERSCRAPEPGGRPGP